jgi:hypothetical protein
VVGHVQFPCHTNALDAYLSYQTPSFTYIRVKQKKVLPCDEHNMEGLIKQQITLPIQQYKVKKCYPNISNDYLNAYCTVTCTWTSVALWYHNKFQTKNNVFCCKHTTTFVSNKIQTIVCCKSFKLFLCNC